MPRWNRAIGRLFAVLCLFTAIWTFILTFGNRYPTRAAPLPVSLHPLFPNATRLIDLRHFRYLINNSVCRGRRVRILALVHSAPGNRHLRDAIRQSWGGKRSGITVIFLLGAVENGTTQNALESESQLNGDIVQGNFADSYRNLTYKHVMGLTWAATYCQRAELMMKMDDDIFVHVFRLKMITDQLDTRHSLNCFVQKNMPVVRDPSSKWYVSQREYPDGLFPHYCSGWAYLTHTSVAHKLARAVRKFPYFWVDDVHVTGTVARAAGIRLKSLNRWYTLGAESLALWASSGKQLDWNYIFGPNQGDGRLTIRAHKKALECQRRQCACCFFGRSVPSTTPAAAKNFGIAESVRIV